MKRILSLAALAAVVLALPAWGQVIRVTAPAAGATWCIGSSYTITWTRSGTMDETVVIRLRLRGGGDTGTRLVINRTENDGSYGPWVVPADVTPGEYFIRINTTDGAVTDSSGAFNIATCSDPTPPPGGSIAVTSPGASSSWRPGSRQTIEWTRTGSLTPMANITLRREGAPEPEAPASRIADGCANNGSRVWFIPESLAEGRYFVRVKSGGVQGDSAVFSIGASGAGSGLPGPLTPIRADLSMPGVGVEYANGNIVAWVKNNGPESVRDHDVKFRLNFPERGGGEQIITRRITVAAGSEKSVDLQAMFRDEIPDAGLRTIVSIDPALSHIQDANRLNQHRDVRLCPLDIHCWVPSGGFEVVKKYTLPSKYVVRAHVHVRHNLGREVRNVTIHCYVSRTPDGPPLLGSTGGGRCWRVPGGSRLLLCFPARRSIASSNRNTIRPAASRRLWRTGRPITSSPRSSTRRAGSATRIRATTPTRGPSILRTDFRSDSNKPGGSSRPTVRTPAGGPGVLRGF